MGKFDLQIDGKLKSLTAGDASWYYGGDDIAWPDLATARIKVPEAIRPNQTIGVLVEGKVVEYIWHPGNVSDEGLVLKNAAAEEVIIEKDVFDTRELAMVKPLLNNKSFVVDKEEGFNGVYKYDSTESKGYQLVYLFNPEAGETESVTVVFGGDSSSEETDIIYGGSSTTNETDIINGGNSVEEVTEEDIVEKDVFDTRELAMINPLADNKSFVVENEEGFNGVYKYNSTVSKGYQLVYLFYVDEVNADTTSFITKWNVVDSISLPVVSDNFEPFVVDYGDGSGEQQVLAYDSKKASHTYLTPGIYEVKIKGFIGGFSFNDVASSRERIQEVVQFGISRFTALNFKECIDLTLKDVVDTPLFEPNASLAYLIANTGGIVVNNIEDWNVANVSDMSYMCYQTPNFNSNISGWNVSNVTTLRSAFQNCGSFDIDLSSWTTSSLVRADYCFDGVLSANYAYGNWDAADLRSAVQFITGPFDTIHYDDLLVSWEDDDHWDEVTLEIPLAKSSPVIGASAANKLITLDNWTIVDNGIAG